MAFRREEDVMSKEKLREVRTQIAKLMRDGYFQTEIKQITGLNKTTIRRICNGGFTTEESWGEK